MFQRLMRGSNGEPLKPKRAYNVLRLILYILRIRRTIAHSIHVNGADIQIDKGSAPYYIYRRARPPTPLIRIVL